MERQMKAVVFERHGGPEVLEYRGVPVPQVGPGEVLLRVRAAAVNYNDIWARRGLPGMDFILPHISGTDAAGEVAEIGPQVRGIEVGAPVVVLGFFSCNACPECVRGDPVLCPDHRIWGFHTGPLDGAQGEFARVPASSLFPKPDRLTWEEAGSFAMNLATSWRMLVSRANIRPGDFVLVWGATGGIGSLALQICRLYNARAIAVVGDQGKGALARELGAEFVIDRSHQSVLREVSKATGRRGVDIVFEHTGAATWETSVHALRAGGTLVTCGATTGFKAPLDIRFLWNKQQRYLGCHCGSAAEFADALRFVERGLIRPVVSEALPLADAARAQEMVERGEVRGKVVLVP
ncbi:MAG: zinc-binding dehydrogenase [Deltaproteobacteria bacterium]|nr:zinc-binding dehydrogenase [Deltaproteobacteria bacterium]